MNDKPLIKRGYTSSGNFNNQFYISGNPDEHHINRYLHSDGVWRDSTWDHEKRLYTGWYRTIKDAEEAYRKYIGPEVYREWGYEGD